MSDQNFSISLSNTCKHRINVYSEQWGEVYPLRRTEIMTQTITANYEKNTNVVCKGCHQRKIFVEGPTTVTVENGERYLTLKCPLPTCGQVFRYNEKELELHSGPIRKPAH